MQFLITGDKHGDFIQFFENYCPCPQPNQIGVIVLGDASINYHKQNSSVDDRLKEQLNNSGYIYYLVKGNHEFRPTELDDIQIRYDHNVNNLVYYQPKYMNINYLIDGTTYDFNGHSALVLGGAYSVDKHYRIARGANWFGNEQLSEIERDIIYSQIQNQKFDFVFSHTCPFSWRPTDMFISGINQSDIDTTMENWLEKVKDNIDWDIWLFGHFHADRLERPRVEIFYHYVEDLEDVWSRWHGGVATESLMYYRKSPNYYME